MSRKQFCDLVDMFGKLNQLLSLMNIFSFSMCIPELVKSIYLWSSQNNVALWGKDTKKKPHTWGQDAEDFHSNHSFVFRGMVGRKVI